MKTLNVNDLSRWIKKSINTLLTTDYTCCRYEIDGDLAFYIGWGEGFDEDDNTIYHNKNLATSALCMKIANTKELVWGDYDCNDMPYYEDGTVYDTDSSIGVSDNFDNIAHDYITEYNIICAEREKGLLII